MMRSLRFLPLALVAGLACGCLLLPARTSFHEEVAELDAQMASLSQRVGSLESGAAAGGTGAASAVSAGAQAGATGATVFADQAGSGVAAVARPGIRWPGLPPLEALVKLIRGVTNMLTGWVELPKRIHETAHTSGAMAGFTYGLVRGIGYGFVRTLGGAYEVVTFPFPAPPGYRPVMRPAYIFTCEER